MAKKDESEVKDKKEPKKELDGLDKALADLYKELGDDCIRKGFNSGALKCEVIPTNIISIDTALGVGGLPKGRITEIFGPESSGKTTFALTVVANAQKAGGIAAYVDVEHAIDPTWCKTIGVNLDELYFSQPDSAEQALTIVEKLIDSNKMDVIVVDSVAALTPESELSGELGDSQQRAALAGLLGRSIRRLKARVRKTGTVLIFINQLRASMSTMPGSSPDTTPGGRALKYYASIRIDIRKIGTNKTGDGDDAVAVSNKTTVKIVKNKVAPPFRMAEFIITFDKGISVSDSLLNTGVSEDVIVKSGAFYSYKEIKLGNGISNAAKFLDNNPLILNEINDVLRTKLLSRDSHEQSKIIETVSIS